MWLNSWNISPLSNQIFNLMKDDRHILDPYQIRLLSKCLLRAAVHLFALRIILQSSVLIDTHIIHPNQIRLHWKCFCLLKAVRTLFCIKKSFCKAFFHFAKLIYLSGCMIFKALATNKKSFAWGCIIELFMA